jgi:hypothetical protein
LKLLFEDYEAGDDETLQNVTDFELTKDYPLHVEIANSSPVCVDCWDGKECKFVIQNEARMLQLRKRVGRKADISFGLISIGCDGRAVDDYDVVKEVCVGGKRMKARLTDYSQCGLFSLSGKIIIKSVTKMMKRVTTMQFFEFAEIAKTEFFSKLKKLIQRYERDS